MLNKICELIARFLMRKSVITIGQDSSCDIVVHNKDFYRQTLLRGSLGMGEAYQDGLWSAKDLTHVLTEIQRVYFDLCDHHVIMRYIYRYQKKKRLQVAQREKTLSQKNVAHHYDEDLQIYEAMLDKKTLSYTSCHHVSGDLAKRQEEKFDYIFSALELKEKSKILNIGSGFGGWEIYCQARGVSVTTVTLSRVQYEYIKERTLFIADQANHVLLADYRDQVLAEIAAQEECFDAITSIEMIEAVPQHELAQYFALCKKYLKTGGKIFLQTIVTHAKRDGQDAWIEKNIFPQGELHKEHILESIFADVGLCIVGQKAIASACYAFTLKCWRENLEQTLPRSLVTDAFLRRMWIYYLSFCEASFLLGENYVECYILEREEQSAIK